MASSSKTKTPTFLPHSESKKIEDRPSLVRDSIAAGVIFALVMTVGQRAIGFVRGLLFCRYMTEQQLGQWSLTFSFLMMLVPLAMLGLPGCFGRFSEHYRSRGQLGYFVSRIAATSIFLTLLASVSMFIFPGWFANMLFCDAGQTGVIYAMAFCVLMVSVSNFLTSLMESLRLVRVVTMMRFVTGTLFATLGLGLVLLTNDAAVGATIGFGLSCFLGAIPAMWILFRHPEELKNTGEHLPHSDMWRRLAPFALWMWASNFFNNCFELSDRYMLVWCSPVTVEQAQGLVGQYHSGRQIPLLLVSLSFMLGGVLIPYMSTHWEKGNKDAAHKLLTWSLKLMSLAFTMVGVGVLVVAPFIFETILEGRYTEGLEVLPLAMAYCIWFGLTCVGQNYLWVAEKGKWIALSVGIGLLSNLVLNALLISQYAVWGAVSATATSNALLLATIYVLNHLFGCKTNASIWYCSAIPLLLLLPTPLAAALGLVVAFLGWQTNLFFQSEEKAEIGVLLHKMMQKVGIGNAG